MESNENKNPEDNSGWTPLHVAAQKGHLQVCMLIMDNLDNKNPGDDEGWTPLHWAAQNNHLKIFISIMDNIAVNKNPGDHENWSPLHIGILERKLTQAKNQMWIPKKVRAIWHW